MHKYLSSLLFLVLLNACLGCSGSSDPAPEEEATQLFESEAKAIGLSVDTPEHVLFERATRFYESGLYPEAMEVFQLLKDGYPFGPYAEFSEVKLADCSFQNTDYTTAATRYEEFVKQHPGSDSTEYAAMQIGRSYQLAHKGLGRDSSVLEKALTNYDVFLKKYPNSPYRYGVGKFRDETVKSIVETERLVIAFYKKLGKDAASAAREESIRARWGDDADKILTTEEPAIEPTFESIRASLNPELIKASLQEPISPPSELQQAEASDSPAAIAALEGSEDSSVLNVECINSQLALYLKDENSGAMIDTITQNLKLTANGSSFNVPGAVFEPRKLECGGLGNVVIAKNGVVNVSTSLPLELFSLNHPTRVVVVAK